MTYDGMSKLQYGAYLAGAPDGKGGGNALLAFLAMQAAGDPGVMCVSIGKENLTHDQIANSGLFNISVLTESAEMPFLQNFGFKSGRDTDKLAGVKCETINGFPTVVENCNCVVECKVFTSVDCGNSTVYFGHILNTRSVGPGKTMTSDYYQDVMEGRVSPKAPAYVARYVK